MNHPSRLALCVAAIITPALFAAGCSSSHSKPAEYRPALAAHEQTNAADPIAPVGASQPGNVSALTTPTAMTETLPATALDSAEDSTLVHADDSRMEEPLDEALLAAFDDIPTKNPDADESNVQRPALTLFRFGFDTTELSAKDREVIQQHGQFLAQHADKKIQLHGHADAQGDPTYNRHLATQRAQHVAELLKQEGVREKQIEIFSWGSDKPIASTNQWRDNRRVELFYEESLMVNATTESPEEARL